LSLAVRAERRARRSSAKSYGWIVFFFYEDTPRIPSSLVARTMTVDAHAVAESRRDRNRPRGHMTLTGARWTIGDAGASRGQRAGKASATTVIRRPAMLRVGGCSPGARVLPLFGKTAAAAAAARLCARKIDGGCFGEGNEMALDGGVETVENPLA